MRKLLATLLLSISLLASVAGGSFYFPNSANGYKWTVSREAQCGVGSVWMKVTRSDYTNNYGNYSYTVWMATNSYDYDYCQKANTYVDDIKISYFDEARGGYYYAANFYPFYMTVGTTRSVYTFYSADPTEEFQISVGKIIPSF